MTAQVERIDMVEHSREITTSSLVAVTAAISVIMFNALPVFLGAAAETFGFSNAQIGTLASAYFIGHTLMTIVAGLYIKRFNLQLAARGATIVAAICFLLMLLAESHRSLMILLAVTGLGGGTLFVFAMSVLAGGHRPTRNIGLCFLMQMVLAAGVIYVCPAVISPRWGFDGVLALFSALFVIGFFLTNVYGREEAITAVKVLECEQQHKWSFQVKPLLALLVLSIYFVGMAAVWAFVERIGNTAGFDPVFVGTVLMASLVAGLFASLLTVVQENRLGLRLPIAAACLGVIVAMLILANGGDQELILFAVAVILFQFSWVYCVNYIVAAVAWLDKSGDHSPLSPAAMGIGIIIGPAAGGLISTETFMPLMIMGIAIAVFVALALGFSPIVKGARQ